MPRLLHARDNRNQPLVEPRRGPLALSYFNLLRLRAGESHTLKVPACEILCVVLSGRADVAACAQEFKNVGRRADIWDGPADSVYCGTCPRVTLRALRDDTEVAVAGAAQPQVVVTRHGDTFLIDHGYHPTVRAPGHEGFIVTILVGHHQRSLVQFFEPPHRHLMAKIPDLQAMRDKFK